MTTGIELVTEKMILGCIVQIVSEETNSFAHTLTIIKRLQKEFPESATNDFVLEKAESAGFFKPEGLVKLAKGLGFKQAEQEALERRLGLRK